MIPWRRNWQPTPVFLPGKSHGQKSLTGYNPWGHKESDTTERLEHTDTHTLWPRLQPLSIKQGEWSVWLESSLTLGETQSSSWCASSSPAGIREGTRESTRWGRERERRKGTMVPFLLSSMDRRNEQLISYDPRALQACRSLACCTSRGRF